MAPTAPTPNSEGPLSADHFHKCGGRGGTRSGKMLYSLSGLFCPGSPRRCTSVFWKDLAHQTKVFLIPTHFFQLDLFYPISIRSTHQVFIFHSPNFSHFQSELSIPPSSELDFAILARKTVSRGGVCARTSAGPRRGRGQGYKLNQTGPHRTLLRSMNSFAAGRVFKKAGRGRSSRSHAGLFLTWRRRDTGS